MAALRLVSTAVLAAALLAPAACGGARGRGGQGFVCQQTVAWGGWDGTPQCAGLAATLISAEDRACEVDEDCTLVAVSTCGAHSVGKRAFGRYAAMPAPCSHPLAGMCPPRTYRPFCQAGCCIAAEAAQGPGTF